MARITSVVACFLLLFAGLAAAQEKQAPAGAEQSPVSKPANISPTARLAAARTVFIKNAGGVEIPFNAITNGFDGWGRYLVVNSPEKADLIVEVTGPSEEGSGVSVSSSTSTGSKEYPQTNRPEQTVTTSKSFSNSPVKMVVRDAKNQMPLWSGFEQPKGALHKRDREDNLVSAAEKLFTRFRDRVDPIPMK